MSNADYISREMALKTLSAAIHTDGFHGDSLIERHELGEDEIEDAVLSIPAADVAPVVRCKDCRFWGVVQSKLCDMHHRAAAESDYCSYGVRIARMKEQHTT